MTRKNKQETEALRLHNDELKNNKFDRYVKYVDDYGPVGAIFKSHIERRL